MIFIIIIFGILVAWTALIGKAVKQLHTQDEMAQWVFAAFAAHLEEMMEEKVDPRLRGDDG